MNVCFWGVYLLKFDLESRPVFCLHSDARLLDYFMTIFTYFQPLTWIKTKIKSRTLRSCSEPKKKKK